DSAKLIGAKVHEVKGDELSDTNYSTNKADRCFFCKSHLFSRLADIAKEKGFDHIICGSNFDDKNDYRPGSRAEVLFNVHAPLMAAGLTTRLAYGLKITEKRLKQIEQAEDFLRQLGLIEFRVRHHNRFARIEVHPEDMGKIIAGPLRTQIVKKLKSLGFKYVTIDLQGFRSGSLNELLTEREKKRNI
ncbi:MAG: adenine nucleotide alpha-hydrolase family protein, partial [Planctomycetota bacterium]